MQAWQTMRTGPVVEELEHYKVIDGVQVEQQPLGAFEAILASWLCYLLNSFAFDRHLGVAVNEVLFTLDATRGLQRRPDVAFVSYTRWPTAVVARTPAWDVAPDLAVEVVSPTNFAEEIDGKITDYFQAAVRMVWVIYPDSGRVYVYHSPGNVRIVERTGVLDGGDILPGLQLPVERVYEVMHRQA